ncbi:MAG TPA: hypothetical protein VFL85_03005 [Candidatus Saccharimonadales bacterium]|nr:hypothetical protein [Candidatus Saccharimonadales bacterium]
MAKANRKSIDITLTLLGAAVTVVLTVMGAFSLYAWHFATSQVHEQLAAQKVYFPPKGSPALDPQEFPGLQKYAGQAVDNGPKAKAYADEFIAVHLEKIGGGKTYAEISDEAMKDPTNAKLQQQKQTMFQGQTLRGLLLGTGYAYWTFGMIALYAAIAMFAGAAVMLVLVLLGLRQIKRS